MKIIDLTTKNENVCEILQLNHVLLSDIHPKAGYFGILIIGLSSVLSEWDFDGDLNKINLSTNSETIDKIFQRRNRESKEELENFIIKSFVKIQTYLTNE